MSEARLDRIPLGESPFFVACLREDYAATITDFIVVFAKTAAFVIFDADHQAITEVAATEITPELRHLLAEGRLEEAARQVLAQFRVPAREEKP